MKSVYLTTPFSSAQRAELERIFHGYQFIFDPEQTRFQAPGDIDAESVEVILGMPRRSTISKVPSLKWLQLHSAGVDRYIEPGFLPDGTILSNVSGAYGHTVSEHLVAMLLALSKKLHVYGANQAKGLWQDEGAVKSIEGMSILVIGFGDIGQAFAQKMHALGARITAVKRTRPSEPLSDQFPYIDALVTEAELRSDPATYFSDAETIALILPSTPETHHFIDADMLRAMRKDTILLNGGRGDAVDLEALMEALSNRALYAAGLDVVEGEPLSQGHPLWHFDNVMVTPHISGGFHMQTTLDRIYAIVLDNAQRYMRGEPVTHQYDRHRHITIK